MGYRNIHTQMFDVRPRNSRGDLDMARILEIQEVLDLAGARLKKNVLSIQKENILKKERRIKTKKTDSKKAAAPSDISWPEILSLGRFAQADYEIKEGFLPDRDELLACLEEIDRADIFLKTAADVADEQPEAANIGEETDLKEDAIFSVPGSSEELSEEIFEPIASPLPLAENWLKAGEIFEPEILFDDEIMIKKPVESEALIFPPAEDKKGIGRKEQKPRFKDVFNFSLKKDWRGFIAAAVAIFLIMGGFSVASRGILAKDSILSSALSAYRFMLSGKNSAAGLDFSSAQVDFETAYGQFLSANQNLDKMGRSLIFVLEKLPGGSIVGSASALLQAGQDLAKAGNIFSQIAGLFISRGSDLAGGELLTQKIAQVSGQLKDAYAALDSAENNLAAVRLADLPLDMVDPVNSLKDELPRVKQAAAQLQFWSGVFLDVFGQKQAKKYLLVFQNNAEARATGGFIGTYGVLDLDQGQIKNLFIDGIFNLDGQLNEKIIPPVPIQKISSAWSTHDANWFADWPTSAGKIMSFYEKAGGATADGIISITPTVVERLLELTGPIDLPKYNVSLNKDNFSDLVQYKVEVDYDKQLNQPKKILADFAPKFLERLWQVWPEKSKEILTVALDSLAQKQILFYFFDKNLQAIFEKQGWTGQIMATDKDYLSVINTNINGYKTDKVIDQKIYHQSQISADGSIIDTIKIVRRHNGGQSMYDYYNKVNADYLRVYVPLGARLLSAGGMTKETVNPPLDYEKMNFKKDADVAAQENSKRIDEVSGTEIFEESGKTVFGNWVYVSPGESVEIIYRYILPFTLDLSRDTSYSLLAQVQAGSLGGAFESVLKFPAGLSINWKYPEALREGEDQLRFTANFNSDKFYGVVFGGR